MNKKYVRMMETSFFASHIFVTYIVLVVANMVVLVGYNHWEVAHTVILNWLDDVSRLH